MPLIVATEKDTVLPVFLFIDVSLDPKCSTIKIVRNKVELHPFIVPCFEFGDKLPSNPNAGRIDRLLRIKLQLLFTKTQLPTLVMGFRDGRNCRLTNKTAAAEEMQNKNRDDWDEDPAHCLTILKMKGFPAVMHFTKYTPETKFGTDSSNRFCTSAAAPFHSAIKSP